MLFWKKENLFLRGNNLIKNFGPYNIGLENRFQELIICLSFDSVKIL